MAPMQASWFGMTMGAPPPVDRLVAHDEQVGIGELSGLVVHTPGHTPGSVCLHVPDLDLLLAGDTLFAGSVGRTDLPGGSWEALQRSIRERLLDLPDGTLVIPGHGPATTIGEERATNPFLG
jgi:hydroxyacylglutathione hydrolase